VQQVAADDDRCQRGFDDSDRGQGCDGTVERDLLHGRLTHGQHGLAIVTGFRARSVAPAAAPMLGPVFGVGAAAAREVLEVFGVFGGEAAPVVMVLVRDVEAVVVGLDVGLVVVKGSPRVGVLGGLPDSRMGERTETLRTKAWGESSATGVAPGAVAAC